MVVIGMSVRSYWYRVLLFMWDVSMLREYEGDGNAGVGDGDSVVAVSVGYEYMGGARDSDSVSSADDISEMSLVRRMSGVGGMCECVYVWLGAGSMVRVSVFGLRLCR